MTLAARGVCPPALTVRLMAKLCSLRALTHAGGLLDTGVGSLSSSPVSGRSREDPVGAVSRACGARHVSVRPTSGASTPSQPRAIKIPERALAANRDHIRYNARRALRLGMRESAILPRLVIHAGTALSWEGPVGWAETVEGLDRGLQEFGRVLIWDLDGIERNQPDLQLLRHFEGESLWVDPGVRFADGVVDGLVAGAERVVVGTKTLRSIEEFEEARELTENLVPLLDFVGGKLWAAESLREVAPGDLLLRWRQMGVDSALLFDERGEFPRPLLQEVPDGLAVFAGFVPRTDSSAMPAGRGAIVDFWEVVPRKT